VLAEGVYVETLQTRDSSGTSSIDLTGNSLANTLIGNAGNNVLDGGAGDDVLNGLGGSDVLNGGNGQDEAHFRGSKAQYTVTTEGAGYRVVDSVAGRDGSTFVNSVETLRFLSDGTTTVLTYGLGDAQTSDPTDKGEPSGQAQSGPVALVSSPAAHSSPPPPDAFVGLFGQGDPSMADDLIAELDGVQGIDRPFQDSCLVQGELLPALHDAFLLAPDDGAPQVLPGLSYDLDPGPTRPDGGELLWSLQHPMDNPLIVHGPNGPHLLQEDFGDMRRLTDFDPWH